VCAALALLASASAPHAQEVSGTTGATAPEGLEPAAPSRQRVRVVIPSRAASDASASTERGCYARVQPPGQGERYLARVLVRPERREVRRVPAKYADVEERVLVRAERTEQVSMPATYRTIHETVVVRPERVRVERTVPDGRLIRLRDPAVTRLVTRQVVEQPARVETRTTPAVYRTVTRRRQVAPARNETIVVPAEWREEQRVRSAAAEPVWLAAPCVRDLTPAAIGRIQVALAAQGHPSADPRGTWGEGSTRALEHFQHSRGLHAGALTLESLEALGVRL
jgi:hypothetical protein